MRIALAALFLLAALAASNGQTPDQTSPAPPFRLSRDDHR